MERPEHTLRDLAARNIEGPGADAIRWAAAGIDRLRDACAAMLAMMAVLAPEAGGDGHKEEMIRRFRGRAGAADEGETS